MSKENEDLLNVGIGILNRVDASNLESVNVDVTKLSDGSKRIAIELVYPEDTDSKDYHIHTGRITKREPTPAQWGRILGY